MRRHALIALLAALAVLLAACGGDDGDNAAERDISDVASDEGDAGDVADEADEDDVDAAKDQVAAFTNEDCADLFAGMASAASAFGGTGPDGGDLTDVAEYFDEIADKVPDEISADFRIFADAYGEFAEAAADAGIDFSKPETMSPAALEKMGEAAEVFNDPEVQAASERVSEYTEETCGSGAGS